MSSYKELLVSRDAFRELQTKIRRELSAHPETSGGEINCIDTCPDTHDLLITGQYKGGQRTHRLIIKDESVAVPRPTDYIELHVDMPVSVIAMLQLSINVAWRQYDGDPTDAESFWNFLVGDVPRETLTEDES